MKPFKHYVPLYICFLTKAIYLYVVTDLTTETFLASLKTFVSRRGKPLIIFSDGRTIFLVVDREINKMMSQIDFGERLDKYFKK